MDLSDKRVVAAIAAIGAVVLIAVGLSLTGSSDLEQVASATTTTASEDSTTPVGLADVEPLDCHQLLTDDELDHALTFGADLDGPYSYLTVSEGETCTTAIRDDERVFVRIYPGTPDDLGDNGELLDVAPDPVAGVGDDAGWFGGPDAEGGGAVGILAFGQTTELGALHVRIALGRPDLEPDEQRDIAVELARAALPRFPGVEGEDPEQTDEAGPPPTLPEREPVDRSRHSYLDNLLAREADGEWTRGEGLAAILGYFAGELRVTQVFPAMSIEDPSGAAIGILAREYLDDESNTDSRAEIERLLELIVPSHEQLLAQAPAGEPTIDETASAPLRQVGLELAQADEEGECPPEGCLANVTPAEFEKEFGKGRITVWLPSRSTEAEWTDDQLLWTFAAVRESMIKYLELGTMPEHVHVILTSHPNMTATVGTTDPIGCTASFGLEMAQKHRTNEATFKQVIATPLAGCMIGATFHDKLAPGADATLWWRNGLSVWLSTLVYPEANYELENLPGLLAEVELSTTILERRSTNWLFFESADDEIGVGGVFDIIWSLPSDGGLPAQAAALASRPLIDQLVNDFAQGLTDESIADSGGGPVPFIADDFVAEFNQPRMHAVSAKPFGVDRTRMVIRAGLTACLEYEESGDFTFGWRPEASGPPGGGWSTTPPETLTGTATFLMTNVTPDPRQDAGVMLITVTDMVDDPEDCEEEDDSETQDGSGGGASNTGDGSSGCLDLLECEPSSFYWEIRFG